MKHKLSRRDFLKIAGIYSTSAAIPGYLLKPIKTETKTKKPNILIIVFDAWSASNISLYGYGRKTTPNLNHLAEKAIVYHNHYAGGNFTTPGTASLLTGTLPWSHKAYLLNEPVNKSFTKRNIFDAMENYQRIAYTHNPIANTLIRQFMGGVDEYIPMHNYFLKSNPLVDTLFPEDHDIATVGWDRIFKQQDDGFSYSLFFSRINGFLEKENLEMLDKISPEFPRGLPNYDGIAYFTLENGIDGVVDVLRESSQPFLGYFHFLPPHNPFKTRIEFNNYFSGDDYIPPFKPNHLFMGESTNDEIIKKRRLYDEYILYVDAEFSRLFENLKSSGILENTYLILTSDHGEMFERGILGHMTPSLHQPVIKIPLLIFPPNATNRVDIHTSTSTIDLLPTLMYLTEHKIPDWAEGIILPPFSSEMNKDIFAMVVRGIDKRKGITKATVMMVENQYKLNWYFGYDQLKQNEDLVEFYNLLEDPGEINNLYSLHSQKAKEMLAITKSKFEEKTKNL